MSPNSLSIFFGIDFSKIDIDVFLIEARNVSVVEEYLAKHEYYLDDTITTNHRIINYEYTSNKMIENVKLIKQQ